MKRARIVLSVGAMALFGVLIATLLSLYAAVLYLVRGPAPFAAHGTTVLTSVTVYYLGGVLGGLVVGLLLPFLHGRVGAALGGAVALLPMYAAAAYALDGPAGLRKWPVYLICALIVGVPVGLAYRQLFGNWYDSAFGKGSQPPSAAA
jgi:hypothetical protein